MTQPASLARFFLLSILSLVALLSLASGEDAQSPTVRAENSPRWKAENVGAPLARDPIIVYNDWSAYDELSDNIPLTEQLAMKELDEILRLRRFGVRFDYYMMDAFWFDPDGGYRSWRKPNWPNGPDAWIKKCRDHGILPGLWFGTNELVKINAIREWQSSLTAKKGEMSFFEGGFLPNFMETMQYWYDQGIRMFKFDFVDFGAATPATEKIMTAEEIRSRNVNAFREALKKFRQHNPDVVLVAFNGFGGDVESTAGPFPFHNAVDLRWLEVFDSLYSGDPRPSDVPEMSFWRSMDIYSDHMVRRYEQSFLPLERIDSTGFMLGNTGTIYYRRNHAWKGALILMMARGGWVNTVHGNLEFLSDEDAGWFAKVQSLYLHLQSMGRIKTFGGIPGEILPYGFGAIDSDGEVYVVVNPAQTIEEIRLPWLSQDRMPLKRGASSSAMPDFSRRSGMTQSSSDRGRWHSLDMGNTRVRNTTWAFRRTSSFLVRSCRSMPCSPLMGKIRLRSLSRHHSGAVCGSSCGSAPPRAAALCGAGRVVRPMERIWEKFLL